jgi:hypothetical protein
MFGRQIDREVQRRARLFLSERDGFYERTGALEGRDRCDYDREEVLRQALEAWRSNPLARRMISIMCEYVVGGGITASSSQPAAHDFLRAWWNHPLNRMSLQVFEWCEELSRAGELFIALSTDASGMSYARAVPASQIAEVVTTENDLCQPLAYLEKAIRGEARRWPAYIRATDAPGEDGSFATVMLHYAVNRPAGAVRGESDLAPVLRWLARYSAWLEDRARLNRYRQTFLYQVKARFASEEERRARQSALNATPPNPGSILVTDDSEDWSVINPQLDSFEASQDGLAIKKMIASGAGLPLHFLAEPEESNRTTAESAGGPAFRHFEQRQEFFCWMLADLLRAVLFRRAMVDRRVRPDAEISVRGADLSARDNLALASAAAQAVESFSELFHLGLIDRAELLRLVYRFAGESVDVEAMLKRADDQR